MKRVARMFLAAILLASSLATAGPISTETAATVEDLSRAIAKRYGAGVLSMGISQRHLPPSPVEPYQITTYAGQPTSFYPEAYQGSDPIIAWAFDFESDGIIDWSSEMQTPISHIFPIAMKYTVSLYAFDLSGEYSLQIIPVEVMAGVGPMIREPQRSRPLPSPRHRSDKGTSLTVTPQVNYALILAPSDYRMWKNAADAFVAFRDTFGYADSQIVLVARAVGNYRSDIAQYIDYPYDSSWARDSLIDFLYSHMDGNDNLHIVAAEHMGGHYDSSTIVYGDNLMNYAPYQELVGLRANKPGADQIMTESQVNYCYFRNESKMIGVVSPVGMNQWAGYFHPLTPTARYGWRKKLVATFQGMTFIDSAKTSDSDFYLEEIKQFVKGDLDHNGYILSPGEVWDYDGDGNPPIAVSGDGFVFDEDDWGDYKLVVNIDHQPNANCGYTAPRWCDRYYDGVPDYLAICEFDTTQISNLIASDLNNDGLCTGYDANNDGDMNDSCGFDVGGGVLGMDDDWAEFLDNLDYQYVTILHLGCHSGGIINDISRPGVVVMTATTEGTVSWENFFTDTMIVALSQSGSAQVYQDVDSNGCISFAEAFNVLDPNNGNNHREMFDDNGDSVGHHYPVPSGGDGTLSALLSWGLNCVVQDSCLGGDINRDNAVDLTDLSLMIAYIQGQNPQPFYKAAADVYGTNCRVDLSDYMRLYYWLLGLYAPDLLCGCAQ